MNFETDLDYSFLNSCSEQELFEYIEKNFLSPNIKFDNGFTFSKVCNIMKIICTKVIRITPSKEQWVFLLADCERLLCEACAGAGKTTMAQLRSIKEKLVHNVAGNNILALAYNTHAVEDMKSRHSSIISMINNLGINDLRRDKTICCYTFHSFCKGWVEEYLSDFGITNKAAYLMSDLERKEAMQLSLNTFMKKYNRSIFVSDVVIDALLSVQSYIAETLTIDNVDAWKMCPNISDLSELNFDEIKTILDIYTRYKSLKHKMDFTDLVDNMYKICCRKEVMRRIRANYQVFILDEYQDFTPSMIRIIKLILEGDPALDIESFGGSRLTCIGDGDQSIYGFRGTDPDNCVRFKETFSSPEMLNRITAMSENRRCPEEVIKYARAVIESNSRRINKPIQSIKPGGSVKVNEYVSAEDEMSQLIQKLRRIPQTDFKQTCICYRNQSSSYMIGLQLVRAGIPFRVAKGHVPLTDKLSQSLFDVLNMLSYPDVLSWADRALYKVVPKSSSFTKKVISEVIKTAIETGKATGDSKLFYDLDFPSNAYNIAGFREALEVLSKARVMHRYNKPMNTYMPSIIKLVRKYYLDWQLQKGNIMSPEYVEYISEWFSQDKSYDDFMKDYQKLTSNLNDADPDKLTLTTFHGLKGLEFKNMYIMDLSDTIFPGTELNQVKDLSTNQKDILECEARRLFYVALTRTKDNLELFFDAKVPSRYIRFFSKNTGLAEDYKDYIHEDNGFLITDMNTSESIASESFDDLDMSALDDLEVETPLAAEIDESPVTSLFDNLERQANEKEHDLIAAYGESNYNQIKGKSVIEGILQRVAKEGKA